MVYIYCFRKCIMPGQLTCAVRQVRGLRKCCRSWVSEMLKAFVVAGLAAALQITEQLMRAQQQLEEHKTANKLQELVRRSGVMWRGLELGAHV